MTRTSRLQRCVAALALLSVSILSGCGDDATLAQSRGHLLVTLTQAPSGQHDAQAIAFNRSLEEVLLPSARIDPCVVYQNVANLPERTRPVLDEGDVTSRYILRDHGDIHITGAGIQDAFSLVWSDNFAFYVVRPLAESAPLLEPGQSVTLEGDGGGRFNHFGWDIAVPDAIELTSSTMRITRGEPVTIDWTAGQGDRVQVDLVATARVGYDGVVETRVVCSLPGGQNTFTLPGELTSMFVEEAHIVAVTLRRQARRLKQDDMRVIEAIVEMTSEPFNAVLTSTP